MDTDLERTRILRLKACPARIVLGMAACLALLCLVPISREIVLLASPWIVGMIVMVGDKVNPVRHWFGLAVTSLFYPLALVTYNAFVIHEWAALGRLPNPVIVVLINMLLLVCIAFFADYLWPRRCPDCWHRSLLPLIPLFFNEQRSKMTHWCARCGEQFWKQEGVWKLERRQTWWDRAKNQQLKDEVAPWTVPDSEAKSGASV